MLVVSTTRFRRARRTPVELLSPPAPPPPPAGPPVLTAAAYDPGGLTVTLTFDRAINLSGADPSQVTVSDGATLGEVLNGTDVTPAGAGGVAVRLAVQGAFGDPGVTLDATADTGIAAAGGGGTWAGVSGLPLPFGAAAGGPVAMNGEVRRVAA